MSSNVYKQFVRSTPGLKEITVIGKIWYEYQRKNGNFFFDYIVVDMPPTGYAFPMLKLPNVYMEAIRFGPIYNEAKKLYDMLSKDSLLVPVSIPEEMAVNETIELIENAKNLLPLKVRFLILNRFFEEFSLKDVEILRNFIGENLLLEYIKRKRERSERSLNVLQARFPEIKVLKVPEIPYVDEDFFDKISKIFKGDLT